MKTLLPIRILAAFSLCLTSLIASANYPTPETNQRACLIAGQIALYGNTIEVKDCMKLNDVSMQRVQQVCEKTLKNASFGKKGLSLTYSQECPTNYQGACTGLNYEGATMDAYYYNRDKATLPAMASGCKAQGAVWK